MTQSGHHFNFELVKLVETHHEPGRFIENGKQRYVINDDLHLLHPIQGKGKLLLEDKTVALNPDIVVYIEPYRAYSFICESSEMRFRNFHFQLVNQDELSIHRLLKLPTKFSPQNLKSIQRKLATHFRAWFGGELKASLNTHAYLHQLTASYFKDHAHERQVELKHDALMEKVRHQLKAPDTLHFNASELARNHHLSVSQLNKRFRRAYQQSPKEYWQNALMRRVTRRLLDDSVTVQSIGDDFGFKNLFYFSRWFKTRRGISPSEFRDNPKSLTNTEA